MPLGRGAAGKVLLAYADPTVREEAWRRADERTLGCWPDSAALDEIRAAGWAKSVAEMEPGLTAISAAVPTRSGGALASLTVSGDGVEISEVPTDDTNLVLRAVNALAEHHGRDDLTASMHLRKRIPVAGGLAGGSADAAAVIARASSTGWVEVVERFTVEKS